jgi:hypothetical protein
MPLRVLLRFCSRKFLRLGWSLLLGIALGLGARAADEAAFAMPTGAAPSWVEAQTWSPKPRAPAQGAPAIILLSDFQTKVTPDGDETYVHLVIYLANAEGVTQNSQLSTVFAPDYEKVTWNTLRITRDDQTSDRLPTAHFKKLQRETSLEEQVYTGLTTAALVMDDVHEGDVLEYAYTVVDTNPLMKGHAAPTLHFGSAYPIDREISVLRYPAAMTELSTGFFLPSGTQRLPRALFGMASLRAGWTEETTPTERVFRWEGKDLPLVPFDANIPADAYPYFPSVRVTTFPTWGSVVDWALPIFQQTAPLPPSAQAKVDQWKRDCHTTDEKVRAALTWVQENFRYFSMAMGEHNLKPRSLQEICSTRFGDCKDKSVLLVRLLRELGLEAWPALANTYWQDRIVEYGPSPYAFNHAIVAYLHDGELRWLDPTLKHQQPTHGRWAVPPYRFGLILRANESALTAIPPDNLQEPDVTTQDHFTFDPASGDAIFDTVVTLRGLQADFYRQKLEFTTPDQLSKNWFNFMVRFYKNLEEVDPPVPQDNPAANQITVRARYKIPGMVHHENGEVSVGTFAYALRSLLDLPESRRRHWPYALPGDRFIRESIDFVCPFPIGVDQQSQVITAAGVDYRVQKSITQNHFYSQHDLRFTAASVPADQMDRFAGAVDEIFEAMSTSLHAPAPGAANSKKATAP